jgi:hypothetical protein
MLSGVYRFPAMESVVFGKPFAEALAQEVDRVEGRRSSFSSAARLPERPTQSTGSAGCRQSAGWCLCEDRCPYAAD